MIASSLSLYPDDRAERDRWIMERRGARNAVEPAKPYAFLLEQERFATGDIGSVATIFLSNRECPWRCVMCDLWQNTFSESVATGSIVQQIGYALAHLPVARQVKLYNSGSFFDPGAIPPDDYLRIIEQVSGFERLIVECHPSLIGERCWRFLEILRLHAPRTQLEVAMGLETVHEEVLEKLNKKMTLQQYASSAEMLRVHGVDLRSFILVQPPFMKKDESLHWACRSIDFAEECGATAISLIPTRARNGAMESLAAIGEFSAPSLRLLEAAQEYGIRKVAGRVFADLWDVECVDGCTACRDACVMHMRAMNDEQHVSEEVSCAVCEGTW